MDYLSLTCRWKKIYNTTDRIDTGCITIHEDGSMHYEINPEYEEIIVLPSRVVSVITTRTHACALSEDGIVYKASIDRLTEFSVLADGVLNILDDEKGGEIMLVYEDGSLRRADMTLVYKYEDVVLRCESRRSGYHTVLVNGNIFTYSNGGWTKMK